MIALSSGEVYLELNTKTRILKYRNVISPRDAELGFISVGNEPSRHADMDN